MAISFEQATAAGYDNEISTYQRTLNGVGAGNLLVCIVFWEGGASVSSVSDGTSSFTMATAGVNTNTIDGEYDVRGNIGYMLSANSGNKTYTVTMSASCYALALQVLEFSTDSGEFALDGQASWGQGSGTTITSGALTTAGTNVVCVSCGRSWTQSSYSNQTIGGSAATEAVDINGYAGYSAYRIASISSGSAVATASGDSEWLAGLVAFSADASGISIPLLNHLLLGD